MVKSLCVLLCLLALPASGLQGQTKHAATSLTMKGYVVDAMCAVSIAKKKNVMEKAAAHTRECCFHKECAASGFGIFAEGGKWVKFDERGSEAAKKVLESSKREKELYFEVTGKMDGETLVVKSMKETRP